MVEMLPLPTEFFRRRRLVAVHSFRFNKSGNAASYGKAPAATRAFELGFHDFVSL